MMRTLKLAALVLVWIQVAPVLAQSNDDNSAVEDSAGPASTPAVVSPPLSEVEVNAEAAVSPVVAGTSTATGTTVEKTDSHALPLSEPQVAAPVEPQRVERSSIRAPLALTTSTSTPSMPVTKRGADAPALVDDHNWPGPITLGFAVAALHRADDGFAVFERTQPTPQFGLFAGYDMNVAEALRLGVELSWGIAGGPSNQLSGEALEARAVEHRALLGVIAAWQLTKQLWPHLRVSGGMGATKVHVDEDAAQSRVDQWIVSPMGELAIGTTLYLPIGRRSGEPRVKGAIGLRVEGGYVLAGKADVDIKGASARSITTSQAALGTLHTGGALLRFALLLRI